jgi:putative phosphoribosyl transferase
MFKDRKDAAEKLAFALQKYRHQDVLVLGLPTGGIEIAYYLARELRGDMSFIITEKINYPSIPQTYFGAIAEDGSEYISEAAKKHLSLEEIGVLIEKEKHAMQKQIRILREERPLPQMNNKIVIITDDGSSPVASLLAAIKLCRKNDPRLIVVAVPEGNERTENILHDRVDEVIILEKLHFYTVVEEGYERYGNLSLADALFFLKRWEEEEHAWM